MKIGFYPGCSMEGTAREYNESVKAVASAFDIELVSVKDWNCCGATAAHSLNRKLSLALPARILALAMEQGLKQLVVPCASCYNRLLVTLHEIRENDELRKEIEEQIGLPLLGEIEIMNVLQFIALYLKEHIKEKITHPFKHSVACYYGCLLVRPHKILKFDRVEDPQTMDEIIYLIGGKPLDWAFKTECCGAGLSVSRTDLVAKLSGNIVEDAETRGAEAIVVACPMCHSNLDMRRKQIDRYLEKNAAIPVMYITQALGLAIGLTPREVGLERHFVKVTTL